MVNMYLLCLSLFLSRHVIQSASYDNGPSGLICRIPSGLFSNQRFQLALNVTYLFLLIVEVELRVDPLSFRQIVILSTLIYLIFPELPVRHSFVHVQGSVVTSSHELRRQIIVLLSLRFDGYQPSTV